MEINDSAIEWDTDRDDGVVSRHQVLPSNTEAKRSKRNRPGKSQRRAGKDKVETGKIICDSTVSCPISAKIPANDHVLPVIPQIYAHLQEESFQGLKVAHQNGIVGFHQVKGFMTFVPAERQWYPYEVNLRMRYKVLDPMISNAFLYGHQVKTLVEYASQPFETSSLQFWTSDDGITALDVIFHAGFTAFVLYYQSDNRHVIRKFLSEQYQKCFDQQGAEFEMSTNYCTKADILVKMVDDLYAESGIADAAAVGKAAMQNPVPVYMVHDTDAPHTPSDEPIPFSEEGTEPETPRTGTGIAALDELLAGINSAREEDKQRWKAFEERNNVAFAELNSTVTQLKDKFKSLEAPNLPVPQTTATPPRQQQSVLSTYGQGSPQNKLLGSFGLGSQIQQSVSQPRSQSANVGLFGMQSQTAISPSKLTQPVPSRSNASPSLHRGSGSSSPVVTPPVNMDENVPRGGGPPGDPGDDPSGGGGGGGGFPGGGGAPFGGIGNRVARGPNENTKKRAIEWLSNRMPKLIGIFHGTIPREENSMPIGTSAARWLYGFYIRFMDFFAKFPDESEYGMSFFTCLKYLIPLCLPGDVNNNETVQWWFTITQNAQSPMGISNLPPESWNLDNFHMEFMARWTPSSFRSDWIKYFSFTLDYNKFIIESKETAEVDFITHWQNMMNFLTFIQAPLPSEDDYWIILQTAFTTTEENKLYWENLTVNTPTPINTVTDFFAHLHRKKEHRFRQTQINLVAKNTRGKQVVTGPEPKTPMQSLQFTHLQHSSVESISERLNSMLPAVTPSSNACNMVVENDHTEAIFCHLVDNIIDAGDNSLEFFYNARGEDSKIVKGSDGQPLVPAAVTSVCRLCKGARNKKDAKNREYGHFVRDCPEIGGNGKSFIGQTNGSADGFREGQARPPWFLEQQAKGRRRRIAITAVQKKKSQNGGGTFARNKRRDLATHPTKIAYQYLKDGISNDSMSDIFDNCENYDSVLDMVSVDDDNQ